MSITDWAEQDRPREKLLAQGASALSDAELLAIFLRVGVHGKSAVDLARDLIAHFGSLARLFAAEQSEFAQIKGMGNAKFTQLQAVFEMSRRALADTVSRHAVIGDMSALKTLIQMHLHQTAQECCIVLYLDAALRLIQLEPLSIGSAARVEIDLRTLAQRALSLNTHALILAHNHPNGHAKPSNDDIQSTLILQKQLQPLGLCLLDHFIVADGQVPYSMAQNGHIPTLL